MPSACIIQGQIPADEFALYEALNSLPGVEFEAERIVQSGEQFEAVSLKNSSE